MGPRVDVCIATCRRPVGLLRLLGALEDCAAAAEAELRIVVVDNDPLATARPVCEEVREWLPMPLLYVVEKRRGIPQARNAALALALGDADFVAFVDDDEIPERGWLAELLRVQRAYGADAVAGPSLPRFPLEAPSWLVEGGFFDHPRHPTGTPIDYAFTHNALVRAGALAALGGLFDERLALSGGSDAELFRRFAASGHRIVWADGARVHEDVPASRSRPGWILARSFRVGCASAWIDLHSGGGRLACLASGAAALAGARAWLAPGALRGGRAGALRALRGAWYGAGRVAGAFGHLSREYAERHAA